MYRTLTKEGPWAVHLTLGQDWGMGRYSRYQYHVYTRKNAQVYVTHASFVVAAATIDFSLIQARFLLKRGIKLVRLRFTAV